MTSDSPAGGGLPQDRARVALLLLAFTSFANYLDRMVLPAVAQPIKLEFGLSDTQLGLLNGFAFVVLYAVSGVPLSRLADRTSRPRVLAGALAFWSLATAASGIVRTFGQLVVARAAVGVGESACQPVGYAVVGDYFPPSRRATAIAWFLVGNSIGVTAGFALGGWLGALYGWRRAFIVVGIPGLLLSLAIARLPSRRTSVAGNAVANRGFWPSLGALIRHRPYRWLLLLNAVYSCTIFGPIAWLPAFFMRSHGLPIQVVGLWTGLAIGCGMGAGMLAGGLLADRLYRRGRHQPQWLGMASILASAAVFIAVLRASAPPWALVATFFATLFGSMGSPVNATAVQNESPVELRATAASLATFAISFVGLGLTPFLIGVLSDELAAVHGRESLRIALLASLSLSVVTALLFAHTARVLRATAPRAADA